MGQAAVEDLVTWGSVSPEDGPLGEQTSLEARGGGGGRAGARAPVMGSGQILPRNCPCDRTVGQEMHVCPSDPPVTQSCFRG